MGIRGFFSDKIGKRENWKSRRTKLCSKKISKNESLGNSEETAKFALKSSQIGLFTCKEGMALLQNLVLNCLKYNLFFSQLGKGCCVSLDYFNSCTITTTVYYTVYSYSGNTTKNEITTFQNQTHRMQNWNKKSYWVFQPMGGRFSGRISRGLWLVFLSLIYTV